MRGAAVTVDVPSVGFVGDHVNAGTEPAEDLGRGPERRAVRAIEQHRRGTEVEPGIAGMQLPEVVLERAVEATNPPYALGRGRRLVEPSLDLVLGVVVELEAVAGEQLDAVVFVRVVGCGDHRREVKAVPGEEQRRGRGRKHAGQQRIAAARGHARGDRRLEHLARLARVANDQDLGAVRRDPLHRRPRQLERELRAQKVTGAATDAIGTEELSSHPGACRLLSAWRTAAASGPSSVLPSSAP